MSRFVPAFISPQGSPIRELSKYTSIPGMISFSSGSPSSDIFDADGLDRAARRAFENKELCLQYGNTSGTPALKHEIKRLMEQRGELVTDKELLVTTGSQQGLDLLLRVMVMPGDTVLVDEPAYPATLQAMKLQGANTVPLPRDDKGIDIDALDYLLTSSPAHVRPKLIYVVPTFANPTGETIPYAARVRLLELVREHDLLLVEDDPYSELRFSGEPTPSFLSLCSLVEGSRQHIVHFSSLSKIVAPGLRVGWTAASPEIISRCVIAKQTADLCSSPWTQEIAAAYLRVEDLAKRTKQISSIYGAKCDAMCTALRNVLGSAIEFVAPEGGLFIWGRLSGGVDSAILLRSAIEEKVLFVPGTAFYADSRPSSMLRLSYATTSVAEIQDGVTRLSQALQRNGSC